MNRFQFIVVVIVSVGMAAVFVVGHVAGKKGYYLGGFRVKRKWLGVVLLGDAYLSFYRSL